MDTPLVSVIIPVYNAAPYLERCLRSITGQTYRNLQILLIDDGSSDASPGICDSWACRDTRIRVIHKENAGAGMARNTGLDHAAGDYVLFVDSDDYMDCGAIEKCMERMAQNPADAVIFGKLNVFEDGRIRRVPVSAEKRCFSGSEIKEQLLPAMFTYDLGFGISVWGKLFRRPVIEENHHRFLSERDVGSEDALFILQVFSHMTQAEILPENLYYYVENTASFSRTYRPDRQEKYDIFLQTCQDLAQKRSLPEIVMRHVQVRYHGYTFAALKQICSSDLTGSKKRRALRHIYNSPVLRRTLTVPVIAMEKKMLQLFWTLVRIRWFWLCDLLLWCKTRKR